MFSVAARVAAGAAWLDEVQPGWERRIDVGALSLYFAERCVLGQVFAERTEGETGFMAGVRLMPYRVSGCGQLAGFGFNAGPGEVIVETADLEAAWISLLKTRFDTGALSDAAPPSPSP